MYSVIIPYFNHWDLVHNRLAELFKFLPDDNEICLVNDASTDRDCVTGAAWWQKHGGRHPIKYHLNKTNLGFGGSMNYGANKMAEGDRLVFLSDDVVIGSDFTAELDFLFGPPISAESKLIGADLLTGDTGWNAIGTIFVPYVNGWFLSCTANSWERLGGFDPRYGKFDYEDVDLSMTALSLGFDLIKMTDSKLQHMGGQTVRSVAPERERLTMENRIKFHEKWDDNYKFLWGLAVGPTRVWSIR